MIQAGSSFVTILLAASKIGQSTPCTNDRGVTIVTPVARCRGTR
jgi:hypothetical protein